jgi:hypothetical protein
MVHWVEFDRVLNIDTPNVHTHITRQLHRDSARERINIKKIQPLDRFVGQDEGISWKHLHRKRGTQLHNMKEIQAASWHRERKAKRESVCREGDKQLCFRQLSHVVCSWCCCIFCLVPQGGWKKMYSFTETCSRHWDVPFCYLAIAHCTLPPEPHASPAPSSLYQNV